MVDECGFDSRCASAWADWLIERYKPKYTAKNSGYPSMEKIINLAFEALDKFTNDPDAGKKSTRRQEAKEIFANSKSGD